MRKHVKVFLAGLLIVVPLAVTVYVIVAVGGWLDGLADRLITLALGESDSPGPTRDRIPPGLGVLALLGAIYVVGLLTRVWGFGRLFGALEKLIARLPGVKVIYESIRDLMKLFGGESGKMGRAVRYHPPGTDLYLLGILTNENPFGTADDSTGRKVAVFLPYAYMFGGPTIYVSPEHVEDVDMPVDQVLKIAATAHVGAEAAIGKLAQPSREAPRGSETQ